MSIASVAGTSSAASVQTPQPALPAPTSAAAAQAASQQAALSQPAAQSHHHHHHGGGEAKPAAPTSGLNTVA